MISSIAIAVVVLSMIYTETWSFNLHSSKIYYSNTHLDDKNVDVKNTTDEKAKVRDISNLDPLTPNILNSIEQNKDSNRGNTRIDNEGIFNEIEKFDNSKINTHKSINRAGIENKKIADEVTTKTELKFDKTKKSLIEDVTSTQDNTDYKISNWKRRVKRDDDDDEEEAIMIWDNCPGKLQYAIIDGELKCVDPSESMSFPNRITESLGKCPKGTRRIILPDRTRMCLRKRSRRS